MLILNRKTNKKKFFDSKQKINNFHFNHPQKIIVKYKFFIYLKLRVNYIFFTTISMENYSIGNGSPNVFIFFSGYFKLI